MKLKYEGKGKKYRVLGIYKPELFKLTFALWWLYVTFDWTQSPYSIDSRCMNIYLVVVG